MFFTIVLLFGSPIQILFTTKDFDMVFDILYTTALVVFVLDIFLNMLVDPAYFVFSLFRRIEAFDQPKLCSCGVGSFNMWCDVVSAATLLYDISYTNNLHYSEEVLELTLDQHGLLVSGFAVIVDRGDSRQFSQLGMPFFLQTQMNLNDLNPSYPLQLQHLDSLILVCKAARVARLFPCTKVVQISSQVNVLWYLERLNPFWHYSRFRRERDAAKKEMSQPQKVPGLMRRASWGVVELAALAKVRALADVRRKTEEKQLGFYMRNLERMKRCFRSMGLLPDANLELKRHIAATKIQRAWRWRLSRPVGLEVTSEDGEGISRFRRSGTSTVERVLKKRSMLGGYNHHHGKMTKDSFRSNSQVGSAMAEVTGQWVASIILFGLLLTILFTYHERDVTRPSTMVVLHGQFVRSPTSAMAEKALIVSRRSTIPDLYSFKGQQDTIGELVFQFDPGFDWNRLREREKLRIIVEDSRGKTEGVFENKQEIQDEAVVELLMTIFVLLVWFLGVAAFAGPVMTVSLIAVHRCITILRPN